MDLKFNIRFNLNEIFGTNIYIYYSLYFLLKCRYELTLDTITAVTMITIFLDVMPCNLIEEVI
jgi:hypothetical protein